VEEILKEIEKEFGRKDKEKGRKIEEDKEEEVRQVEIKKKEMPIVVAIMPRKQIARRRDKSRFWMR